jgi:uncharacterized delta-60 repeat protein
LSLELLEDRTLPSANFFGAEGTVVTPFRGAQVDSASSVLVQPNGKIVAVGTAGNAFALARYNDGGVLDPTFGSGGRVRTQFPGDYAAVTSAALQANGKILVAGYNSDATTGALNWVLTRYTDDGVLDNSFGSGGQVTVLQGTNGFGEYVTALPNGEIAVAGNNYDSSTATAQLVVEEYTAAGTPDTAFGNNGRATTALGPSGGVTGLARQGDNLIVAGDTYDSSTSTASFVVARYTPTGTLDTTFGSGGLATIVFGQNGNARGVAVGRDGAIVVGGNTYSFTPTFSSSGVVARFTANGAVDASFGSGGLATTTSASESAVAVQSDGKVVMAGSAGGSLFPQFALVRFTAAGGLDGGFGSGGLVTTAIGSAAGANAVALRRDDKIVAAGYAFDPATGNDFALARYTPTGALLAGFGSGGTMTTNFVGQVSARANSVVQDREGHLLVAGTTTSGGDSLSLARYRRDGSLDTSFGSEGRVQVTFNPFIFGPRSNDGYVAVQSDGKIMLVGTSIEPGTTNYDFALARLLPNGQLDPTFGSGGKVTTFSGAQFTDMAPSGGVAIDPDGKILVAGYTEYYGPGPDVDKGVVERYNPDGSLDTTFGSGGRATIDLPQSRNRVTSFALEPDGKILVGGFVFVGRNYFLDRLQSDGVADATFGTGGLIITNFSGSFTSGGPLTIRPDGKILVGGTTTDPVTFQRYMTVAQFTADGALDTSYGTGGQASVSFGGFASLRGMTLQSDGKVVVVGTAFVTDPTTQVTTSEFAVARFTATGSVDTSFGNGGTVTTSIGGFQDGASAVLVQNDGTLVVVGSAFDTAALLYDYALVEFNPDGSRARHPRHGRP